MGARPRCVAAAGNQSRTEEASGGQRRGCSRRRCSGTRGVGVERLVAAQDGADGQEVGHLADVVDAEHAPPASAPQPTRGERAGEPLARPARSVIAPTKSLRETASSSGRPSSARRQAAQDRDGLGGRLAEVRARVEQHLLGGEPAARAASSRSASQSRTSAAGSAKRSSTVLLGLGRARGVCMST